VSNRKSGKFTLLRYVSVDSNLHKHMRELKKRKHVTLSILYNEALEYYLDKPENYLGKDFKP